MATSKRVVWSSLPGSDQFVVGGGSEIRLYNVEETKNGYNFNTKAVCSDLGQLRAFDWASWSAQYPDLVAAGLTTGKTLVLRLEGASRQSSNAQDDALSLVSAFQISARLSRPVNAVAFARSRAWLTVGLDKARGESLLTYDIEQSCSVLLKAPMSSRPQLTVRTSSDSSRSSEPVLLSSLGASEGVSAIAYLSDDVPLLASSMGGKTLRVYDLRMSPPATASVWSSRAVTSIAPNPFDANQFAAAADDGIIRLFDLRKSIDPLLSWSELDAGSIRPAAQSNQSAKPVQHIAWDKSVRGSLASSSRDGKSIRLWHILLSKTSSSHSMPTAEVPPLPVLLDDQDSSETRAPIGSFAFAPFMAKKPGQTKLLAVTRDTDPSGLSSFQLETLQIDRPLASVMTESSVVAAQSGPASHGPSLRNFVIETKPASDESPNRESARSAGPARPAGHGASLDRGRSVSINSIYETDGRDETPRPKVRVAESEGKDFSVGELTALHHDPATLVRQRIEKGYGFDAMNNADMTESSLHEFWLWAARAQTLVKEAAVADFDFRWRGVIPIITGFPSHSALKRKRSKQSDVKSQPSVYNNVSRTLRRGDEARQHDAAFSAASSTLVSRLGLESVYVLPASQFVPQRRLALSLCGTEWQQDAMDVANRYHSQDDHEGAARHAFFNGYFEESMRFMQRSGDDRLALLAPTVAAYITQRGSSRGVDNVFADMCRSQSADNETPWIRAMFAFCASGGSWRELVDETGIVLRDRVAVALRFLSDHELVPYLNDLAAEGMSTGDIEFISLFGLRDEGVRLLTRYLDRTADVQTAALAAALVQPSLSNAAKTARHLDRCIHAYRDLLDRLSLHLARALFDSEHARISRAAKDVLRSVGLQAEAQRIDKSQEAMKAPQMQLRCTFCSGTIKALASRAKNASFQPDSCPQCNKKRPNCTICQKTHSTNDDETGVASIAWCATCRHGGHVMCLSKWFDQRQACPVAGCDCRCSE